MRLRRIAAGMALISAGLAAPCDAAERPKVVREAMTIESHKLVRDKVTKKLESPKKIIDVAVYRPNDGLKHPAIVYLHGGGMSFADPLMDRFHVELASRGLVVLAPHYLLNGTGWPHWHESAVNTVTLAASLPSVDPDHIGMSGISMGGQIGLSTAARDPRIKAVAEFFTAWPGTLPDEPIADLPPVLLLNGTADPIIPFDKAMALDAILRAHGKPFERHVYVGQGHGFGGAAFDDAVVRTATFFGGDLDGRDRDPGALNPVLETRAPLWPTIELTGADEDDVESVRPSGAWWASLEARRKRRRRAVGTSDTAPRATIGPQGAGRRSVPAGP
jgi:acetyl esterase/lipase